jgi:hypothetical protein
MSEQAMVEEISGLGQLIADFMISSGDAFGVPQQRHYPTCSALFDSRPTAVHVYAERRF